MGRWVFAFWNEKKIVSHKIMSSYIQIDKNLEDGGGSDSQERFCVVVSGLKEKEDGKSWKSHKGGNGGMSYANYALGKIEKD